MIKVRYAWKGPEKGHEKWKVLKWNEMAVKNGSKVKKENDFVLMTKCRCKT